MEIEAMSRHHAGPWSLEGADRNLPSGAHPAGSPCTAAGGIEPQAGPAAAPLSEEVIQAVLENLSAELAAQARLDRLSIQNHRERCRAMRREVLRQMRAMRKAAGRKRRRGLLAKIFKWVAAALAAVAAAATAVFTGGGSLAAYGVAIGAAAAGGALGLGGGGARIAAGMAAGKELDAAMGMKRARMAQALSRDMQEELLAHLDDLIELDGRIGRQARAIMNRYDGLRQLSLKWR